jgi:hypothetical protein
MLRGTYIALIATLAALASASAVALAQDEYPPEGQEFFTGFTRSAYRIAEIDLHEGDSEDLPILRSGAHQLKRNPSKSDPLPSRCP